MPKARPKQVGFISRPPRRWRQAASGYLHVVSDALSPRPLRRANWAPQGPSRSVCHTPEASRWRRRPPKKRGWGGFGRPTLHLGQLALSLRTSPPLAVTLSVFAPSVFAGFRSPAKKRRLSSLFGACVRSRPVRRLQRGGNIQCLGPKAPPPRARSGVPRSLVD